MLRRCIGRMLRRCIGRMRRRGHGLHDCFYLLATLEHSAGELELLAQPWDGGLLADTAALTALWERGAAGGARNRDQRSKPDDASGDRAQARSAWTAPSSIRWPSRQHADAHRQELLHGSRGVPWRRKGLRRIASCHGEDEQRATGMALEERRDIVDDAANNDPAITRPAVGCNVLLRVKSVAQGRHCQGDSPFLDRRA